MTTPTRQRQSLAAATDPPGALVPYRQRGTPVPTKQKFRHDPLAVAGLGVSLLGGIAAIAVATYQIRSGIDASPPPTTTTAPAQATASESPTPLGLVLFGGVLLAAFAVRNRANRSPDCPNHCPENQPCRCGRRQVSVRVELND